MVQYYKTEKRGRAFDCSVYKFLQAEISPINNKVIDQA